MKIILTGGGTGGHVTPALNVAKKLLELHPDTELLFIGRHGGSENDAVKRMGLKLCELEIYGIKRSLSPSNLKRALIAIRSIGKAKKIIKDFSPDVILGTGGYVCWPVLTAGRRLGIPTAIHESNLYPGLVTRLLAKNCSAVLLNHKETSEYLKSSHNITQVGNPVSDELFRSKRVEARYKLGIRDCDKLIVSFGGSGGAENLNRAIIEMMEKYSSKVPGIKHIHATGKMYFEKYGQGFRRIDGCEIMPYINDMPTLLAASDVTISRCGAMTLSELAAAGCCSVLIPSPNVTNDHQRKNGEYLAKKKAAILIEECEASCEKLIDVVSTLLEDRNAREKYSRRISALADRGAARKICTVLSELSGEAK